MQHLLMAYLLMPHLSTDSPSPPHRSSAHPSLGSRRAWLRILPLIALAFAGMPRASHAQELVEVRRVEQTYVPVESRAVRLDLSFGDIVVRGADREDVGIEIVLSCPSGRDQVKCQNRAARLVLEARNRTDHLVLRLRRTPRARLHGIRSDMTVHVPSDHNVEVDVRAGSVEISGVNHDIEVDIGSGDTTIFYPQAAVSHVKGHVGAGRANLWLEDESQIEGSGWPRSFSWRHTGNGTVEIDAGTGDISVRLMPDSP